MRKRMLVQLPNLFTLLRLVAGVATFVFLYQGRFSSALYLFLFATLTDIIDGRLARYLGAETRFGRVFDRHTDFVIVQGTIALLVYTGRAPWFAGLLLVPAVVQLVAAAGIVLTKGVSYLYDRFYFEDGGAVKRLAAIGYYAFAVFALLGVRVEAVTLIVLGFHLALYSVLIQEHVPTVLTRDN